MTAKTTYDLLADSARALERIAKNSDLLRQLRDLTGRDSGGGPAPLEDPTQPPLRNPAAWEGTGEELIVRATVGHGTLTPDGRYIVLKSKMYTMDGEEDGHHEGVFESVHPDPAALLPWFVEPDPPFDEPRPVDRDPAHLEVRAYTAAIWTFRDGSSITAVGPAVVHLAPAKDGAMKFFVSVAASITNGTGRYRDAVGIKTANGSTYVSLGEPFGPGASFPGRTIETFRVIRRQDIVLPPETPPSVQFPYESRYATVHGSRMHYVEKGSGDPILFVHGNPTSSYLWRNVLSHVVPYGRCIAPDLIGMGKSDKPDIEYRFMDHARYLEGFIEALGLKDLIVVGHDWGSALGFHYAMRYDSNVRGLAFMEALIKPYESWEEFPTPEAPPALRDIFRAFRTGGQGTGQGWELIVNQNVFLESLLPQVAGRPLRSIELDRYREPFLDPASRLPVWRWPQELPIAGEPSDMTEIVASYSRRLQSSRLPKLLVYGVPGAVTSASHVRWCREHLPNCKTVCAGWGMHLLQETNPDLIGREIAAWVQDVRSSVPAR